MIELSEAIQAICGLPDAFRAHTHPGAGRSARALAMESGFRELKGRISADEIAAQLDANPDYLRHWQQWSEDKRVSEGWYYRAESREVGWFSAKGGVVDVRRFSSDAAACAAFILREMEALTS
jgi:hypothetical protein